MICGPPPTFVEGLGDADLASLAGVALGDAGLARGDGVRESCLGLLLKKVFLNFSNSSTSLGVGVNGFFVAHVSLSARSAAFPVRGISSITEMTFVNKRCSESELAVFGFKNLYISAPKQKNPSLWKMSTTT